MPLRPRPTFAIAGLATALLLAGCNNDSDSSGSVSASAVKQNHVAMARAGYQDSLSSAEALQSAVDTFLANPTAGNLQAARDAYKTARKPYQQTEIMRWDTAITNGQDLAADGGPESVDAWEGQVNAWPLDETLIESIIAGNEPITAQLLIDNFEKDGNEANVTTGIHAIEFMLWDQDQSGPGRGPGQRSHNEFASNASCAIDNSSLECRNAAYLKAATDLLVDDLRAMAAEWSETAENTQGTLAYNFLNSNQALDQIAQALASMGVGELGGARLSAGLWRPNLPGIGYVDGDLEEEHDCFSDLSHVALYYNFQGLLNAFYGSYQRLDGSEVSGTSFASYIRAIDPSSYQAMDSILQDAKVQMEIVYQAGENGTSFDDIIAESRDYYDSEESGGTPAAKSAALVAVEALIARLADIEQTVLDISEALSLAAVDPDAIGETD
ncbi:MAG TPA: imelysin family protein [Pseudomonadales bacterium]